jgi:hypothetical protein
VNLNRHRAGFFIRDIAFHMLSPSVNGPF